MKLPEYYLNFAKQLRENKDYNSQMIVYFNRVLSRLRETDPEYLMDLDANFQFDKFRFDGNFQEK